VLVAIVMPACATAGPGDDPPLPGVSSSPDSGATEGDASGPSQGDDAAGDDAGGPSVTDSGSSSGGTCNDFVHGLRALIAVPPMSCTTSTDCPSGDCCYVGAMSSACVMQ
jgi:hypothetical protein